MRGLPRQGLPNIKECIDVNVMHARLTNPKAQCVGICLNTSAMDDSAAAELKAKLTAEFGIPCVDPLKDGVDAIVDQLANI